MADLLGTILSSMEKPPSVGDQESRRQAREQAARLKKMQEEDKRHKAEFRKRMEKLISDFIQSSTQKNKKFDPMNKLERSILHDVVEVAGLTSFSFGDDDESRYVMIFKKVLREKGRSRHQCGGRVLSMDLALAWANVTVTGCCCSHLGLFKYSVNFGWVNVCMCWSVDPQCP
ncbi:sperm-associated antigen 7 homolog [Chiloscyllium plagiosum]|uniref:sperm-associated antigen 7 homolog n=1 Tax=Chiloscyllium plagiosum TaxID=36176 RepID=UPI001CB7CD64|nr:sperm-associated antigen 7 homolog [Chiloscyllium plagiosum]